MFNINYIVQCISNGIHPVQRSHDCYLSLSTLVFNSRDRYKNIRLPKNMHFEKQPLKNHNAINQLQPYWYNTNNFIQSSQMLLTLPDSEF